LASAIRRAVRATPAPTGLPRARWAFCKREDALHIEFLELARVTDNPGEGELLAQLLRLAVVGLDVDGALEPERLVQRRSSLSRIPFAAFSALM
jgi:hypothetical protein